MEKIRLNLLTCIVALVLMTYVNVAEAQDAKPRPSPAAVVTQRIGVHTDVTMNYSRPGVKGRKVWGELVSYGMNPGNKYSKDKPYPWRAGANENTTIEFNHDLTIEGQKIAAGKYSVHMVPSETTFKIMINKVSDAWGSYTYDAANDVITVTVTPVKDEHMEWFQYSFDELSDDGATANLRWEKLKIPFKLKLQ